jgi:hypothetical protein
MSELAFDGNGEPITFPAAAEELRVRRFRNPGMRGACEVVHDRDGAPLYVPVDTSYVEFRALVDGVSGRYRLDPVDAGRQVMANTAPAYVTITEPARNMLGPATADDRDSVIRELARANAEMTTTIADRFASVMQAAADLLRAADGAGLPRREPVAQAQAEDAAENDDDDGDDGDEHGDDSDDVSPNIASLVAQLLPMIQMWLATKAADKPAAASPAAASPSAAGPARPLDPAAATGMTGVTDAAAGREREPSQRGSEGDAFTGVPEAPPSMQTPEAVAGSSTSGPETFGKRPGDARNASPAWSPGQMNHLLAIHAALLPEEKRIAQLVVARMTPEVRAQWLGELSVLTVEQAVALVRSMIPRAQPRKESDS